MAETTKYIAYISLDYLQDVFMDQGWLGEPEKQQEFIDKMRADIDKMRADIDDFIQNGDKNVYQSWMWYDNEGRERHAVEFVPVQLSDEKPLYVSEELWQMLKNAQNEQNKKE